jgi:hypothetical protein
MSIVITVVTPEAVAQVSDMQLTAFSDGTIVSGRQRKSMAIVGTRVSCVVGWVGLATIGNHNTGSWLHRQLDAMGAISLDIQTLIKTLADSATIHFALLPKTDKRCSFTFGGWFHTPTQTLEPFLCRVSNCEFGKAGLMSQTAGVCFEHGFMCQDPKKPPSKHPYLIYVTGDDATVSELPQHFRGLRGLLKRRVDVSRISIACRQIALAIADRQEKKKQFDPKYVKTVGRNHLALEMDLKKGTVQSLYFPEDKSASMDLIADILSPGVSMKNVVTDSRVNSEGNTELSVKGWFKWNQQNEPSGT